ncbi:MAG: methyltransferase domain-containing protein [Candidatus Aenigmarchaeota archaeon]|nr:methyltransferase domain-containing protein [Candidatus Aenigmarchaeota archaeon]
MVKTGKILTTINKRKYKPILKILQKQKNIKKLLDVGCRDGQFTVLLDNIIENDTNLYGLDNEKKAVKLATKRGIKATELDIENQRFPYANNYFDCITCLDVIEHVVEKDFVIEEIYRVLKPGGILILSTPNLTSWINRILFLIGIEPILTRTSTRYYLGIKYSNLSSPPDHINLFSFSSLKKFLRIYNFKIIKIKGTSYFVNRFLFFRPFEKILFRLFPSISDNLIIVAKKMN